MRNSKLQTRIVQFLDAEQALSTKIRFNTTLYNNQQKKLQEVEQEQAVVVKALQALKDVKPLLAASAVEKAEKLANSAISAIFDFPAKLRYDEEEGRFIVETPEGDADLQEGTGGGLQAVVSFVFQVFLLMKEEARLFMVLDEHFTQLDDNALVKFVEFLNQLCEDLSMEIVLVSHDARIEEKQVNHLYFIEDGKSVKVK